jgi:uncharacterized membrane protein
VAISYSHGKQTASAKRRLTIAAIAGVAALLIAGSFLSWTTAPLIGLDIAAGTYLVWMWLTIWQIDDKLTPEFALREDPSRTLADSALILASLASLVAVGVVLIGSGGEKSVSQLLQVALGVLSVVLSWALVHTIFMLRYAELYYKDPAKGVDFAGTTKPTYTDFAYLTFTLGMTFQVSDTDLKSSEFRSLALRHALMSYVFGTIIVATTINLVAGLSK